MYAGPVDLVPYGAPEAHLISVLNHSSFDWELHEYMSHVLAWIDPETLR
jgi:hypothetical protein